MKYVEVTVLPRAPNILHNIFLTIVGACCLAIRTKFCLGRYLSSTKISNSQFFSKLALIPNRLGLTTVDANLLLSGVPLSLLGRYGESLSLEHHYAIFRDDSFTSPERGGIPWPLERMGVRGIRDSYPSTSPTRTMF